MAGISAGAAKALRNNQARRRPTPIILSGDRHSAALYQRDDAVDYRLFEATSSSLNLPASKWRAQSGDNWVEEDPNRSGGMFFDANYGRIDIDWEEGGTVFVRILDANGETALGMAMPLSSLEAKRK